MVTPGTERCGYVWPWIYRDGVPEEDAEYCQSCCWRERASETTDRCIWHANPDEIEQDVEALQSVLTASKVRSRSEPAEVLDGANVAGVDLKNSISFENVQIREADLSNVFLSLAQFSDANLYKTDLSGSKLFGADFSDAALSKADLSNTELKQASLVRADLKETDLSEALIREADFTEANLKQADLSESNLIQADFTDASLYKTTLTGASLAGADLSTAGLESADLSNAYLNQATLSQADLGWITATGADLTEADLSEAFMMDADLSNAELTDADLSGAFVVEADLSDADLSGADLSDADLRKADLSNADLTDADLSHADLSESVLTNATLAKATLQAATLPSGEQLATADLAESDLRGQDLRDAELAGAHLPKADLTDADLSGANLAEANLERALLNRADLFDTRFAGARLDGAVFGDAQINEATFKKLAPRAPMERPNQSLTERAARLTLGPIGHDAYRCVYDPASQYDSPPPDAGDAGRVDARSAASTEQGDSLEVRAGGVYREFERLATENALPGWQRRFFILRQDMQTRQKTGVEYWFAVLQRALFGYGESFGRVVGWSSLLVSLFAVVYLIGGWIRPVSADGTLGSPLTWTQAPTDPTVIWESLYYSTLTFTALGFDDFRPVGTVGQLLTVLETASGALLVALLVFVLGRRAAR